MSPKSTLDPLGLSLPEVSPIPASQPSVGFPVTPIFLAIFLCGDYPGPGPQPPSVLQMIVLIANSNVPVDL